MYSFRMHATSLSAAAVAVVAQPNAVAVPQRRLLDPLREQLGCMRHSLRTEEAYVHWVRVRAFVRWSGMLDVAGGAVRSPLDALQAA